MLSALLLYTAAAGQPGRLEIHHLADGIYIYTTYKEINGQAFPSNSMYVVTADGIVMIDTPWDTTQFQPLMDSIVTRHRQPVVLCIATHYHDDRTAGLQFLNNKGIATYTSRHTYELCAKEGNPQAAHTFVNDTSFTIGGTTLHTYYPGEGHAPDNIVIWLPKEKLLYGGCLVKSTENSSLGNVVNANLQAWPQAIRNVMQRYTKPRYIIPGHFGWDGKPLEHTLRLLRK